MRIRDLELLSRGRQTESSTHELSKINELVKVVGSIPKIIGEEYLLCTGPKLDCIFESAQVKLV